MPYDELNRVIADIDEVARLACNRRIMEKRVETGCYAEDGLYCRKRLESPLTIAYLFVDGSSLLFSVPEELVYFGTPTPLGAPIRPTMAEAWLQSGGMDELKKELSKSEFSEPV